MSIKIKRWCHKSEVDDGFRILICRYRPRGLLKRNETWHIWLSQLAPSRELHAKAYGKHGQAPLMWEQYVIRYHREQENRETQSIIECLAYIVQSGLNITLLCSSACVMESRCHRSLL